MKAAEARVIVGKLARVTHEITFRRERGALSSSDCSFALHYALGVLFIRFRPLWAEASKLIGLIVTCDFDLWWKALEPHFEEVLKNPFKSESPDADDMTEDESEEEETSHEVETLDALKSTSLKPLSTLKKEASSMLRYHSLSNETKTAIPDYFGSIWDIMITCGVHVERKSRQVVPLIIDCVKFSAGNRLRTLNESIIPPDDEDEEKDEKNPAEENKEQAKLEEIEKSGKEVRGVMEHCLNLILKFQNMKSLYQSQHLLELIKYSSSHSLISTLYTASRIDCIPHSSLLGTFCRSMPPKSPPWPSKRCSNGSRMPSMRIPLLSGHWLMTTNTWMP